MNNTIVLVVGDWSRDGHEITENVTISCNKTYLEVDSAYDKGCKKAGFVLHKYCDEYEDRMIDRKVIDFARDNGVEFDKWDTEEIEDTDRVGICVDKYVKIYLALVLLGDPEIKYEIISGNHLHIGGYGLFF